MLNSSSVLSLPLLRIPWGFLAHIISHMGMLTDGSHTLSNTHYTLHYNTVFLWIFMLMLLCLSLFECSQIFMKASSLKFKWMLSWQWDKKGAILRKKEAGQSNSSYLAHFSKGQADLGWLIGFNLILAEYSCGRWYESPGCYTERLKLWGCLCK